MIGDCNCEPDDKSNIFFKNRDSRVHAIYFICPYYCMCFPVSGFLLKVVMGSRFLG